jgi:hypothetical protein
MACTEAGHRLGSANSAWHHSLDPPAEEGEGMPRLVAFRHLRDQLYRTEAGEAGSSGTAVGRPGLQGVAPAA